MESRLSSPNGQEREEFSEGSKGVAVFILEEEEAEEELDEEELKDETC